MKSLVVVDFSYLYYKYYFMLNNGKLKRLSYNDRDISLIYYPLREIESIRKKFNDNLDLVVVFDSKSSKIEIDSNYKAQRKSVLNQENFNEMAEIRNLLNEVGYMVLKKDGFEADDLIASVVLKNRDYYIKIVIYTADMDLLSLIDNKTEVMLFRQRKGYENVDIYTYEIFLENSLKVKIPYNTLFLYKILVGDNSDNIEGIKGFGKKSFEILMNDISRFIEFSRCGDYKYVKSIMPLLINNIKLENDNKEELYERLEKNIELVKFNEYDSDIEIKSKIDENARKAAYEKYNFKSLM